MVGCEMPKICAAKIAEFFAPKGGDAAAEGDEAAPAGDAAGNGADSPS